MISPSWVCGSLGDAREENGIRLKYNVGNRQYIEGIGSDGMV
jgi:hypothetical protein